MEEYKLGQLRYVIRYPQNFASDQKYPVLFFFTGAGSRGNNMELVTTNPFFEFAASREEFPFVIVAPLCARNSWYDLWEHVQELVRHVAAQPFADRTRFYIMGASMGGYATWQLAMSMPEYFAAIVPICGGGMYWNAFRLKNIPAWAFHGAKDPTVLVDESVKMVDAVNRKGGSAKLTVYPENGHDAWSDTYTNPEVYTWLLQHVNETAAPVQESCDDPVRYG